MVNAATFIKQWESCRLTAYQDVAGIWTVGWGQTGYNIYQGVTVTQQQADQWLSDNINEIEQEVLNLVTVSLNQNQLSALDSFVYNVGIEAFTDSTMLKLLNLDDFANAADQFLIWDHGGGKVITGLENRRIAEKALFLTPIDNNQDTANT